MSETLVIYQPHSEVLYADRVELLESNVPATFAGEGLTVVDIEHIEIGQQGPPGPPGPPGAQTFAVLAGQPLMSNRAVRLLDNRAYLCDGNEPDHVGACVGVTTTAGLTGQVVTVRALGRMEDAGWSWTSGPLFVGANGVMSALPGTAFVQEIAQVDSPTRITIGIRIAVLR